MKGIVFTEFLDMVAGLFDTNMVDDILDDCDLESGGAYTAIGTYDNGELVQIVSALSKRTNLPVKDLIHKYGYHLFFRFYEMMPDFFEAPKSAFEFLESVDGYIHVEVKKLYPDASLPHFETKRSGEDTLIMTYTSHCPFADFAEGLIYGCVDFYNETVDIQSEDKNTNEQFCRIFTLVKQ